MRLFSSFMNILWNPSLKLLASATLRQRTFDAVNYFTSSRYWKYDFTKLSKAESKSISLRDIMENLIAIQSTLFWSELLTNLYLHSFVNNYFRECLWGIGYFKSSRIGKFSSCSKTSGRTSVPNSERWHISSHLMTSILNFEMMPIWVFEF